jgi:hypothetical protein
MSTPARILMVEGDTAPPVPAAGQVLFYAKTTGTFYSMNSLGVETPLGGGAIVTSVDAAGTDGILVAGGPITSSGTLTFSLGNITPDSVAAVGTVTGSNLSGTSSGTNTGDQTITLSGDATGSGTGLLTVTLSDTAVTPSTYGDATHVPTITVDSKGRITGVVNTPISVGGLGTVTDVSVVTANGVSGTVANSTTTPEITLVLGAITPSSVAAVGTVSGSNLSGTNTGDQTITLTGDVTGSGSSSFATALSDTGVTAATYGSSTEVPVFTVDAKGRITGVTNTVIASSGSGTVTSVDASGGTTGLTFTGGPVTGAGTLTLSGTLNVPSGGTGAGTLTGYVYGNGTDPFTSSTTIPGTSITGNISGNAASITSTLDVGHGGTGATTLSGYLFGNGTGAFTSSATIPGSDINGDISGNAANVTGIVSIANGGTGSTTADDAVAALLPVQTGQS